MIRFLLFIGVIALGLNAASLDDKVIEFEKKRFGKNKRIQLLNVDVFLKKQVKIGNAEKWYGYIVNVTAKVKGQEVNAKDIVFTNGTVLSSDLEDLETGESLKDSLTPNLSAVYYNKRHLIVGNHNAKDKLVIFSDPLCPFCKSYLPTVINHVKKNSESIALYYYHYPLLRLHPASEALSKAMIVAHKKGVKNVELITYQTDFSKYFSEQETNAQTILNGFNTVFKTNIALSDIQNVNVKELMLTDMSMGDAVMVQGTPTIFVNGEVDNKKLKYETLGN